MSPFCYDVKFHAAYCVMNEKAVYAWNNLQSLASANKTAVKNRKLNKKVFIWKESHCWQTERYLLQYHVS